MYVAKIARPLSDEMLSVQFEVGRIGSETATEATVKMKKEHAWVTVTHIVLVDSHSNLRHHKCVCLVFR